MLGGDNRVLRPSRQTRPPRCWPASVLNMAGAPRLKALEPLACETIVTLFDGALAHDTSSRAPVKKMKSQHFNGQALAMPRTQRSPADHRFRAHQSGPNSRGHQYMAARTTLQVPGST